MTNDQNKLGISRRKVLGGMGMIGLASAGAGLGTTAFFSDDETFEGNTLVAGSLDLRVDWEEHYSDWSDDESEGLSNPVLMEDPGDDVHIGLPDPQNPMIWVHENDLGTFMDNTSIEAYPDTNDNGIQDDLSVYDACEHFAQLDRDLNPTNGYPVGTDGATAKRTSNEDTLTLEGGNYLPLVNINDVKPGDFGELTLSFHLCDNPGYVWLQGELVDARENGITEPEGEDPHEDGDDDSTDPENVELLDAIQTMLWYDEDGDNVLDLGQEAESVCVQLVLDASGSMSGDRNTNAKSAAKTLATSVLNANPDNRVGVTFFSADGFDSSAQVQLSVGSTGDDDSDSTPDPQDIDTVEDIIDTLPANGGSTAIGEGILTADEDLSNCPSDAQAIQIVITDGSNNAGTTPSIAADDVVGTDSDDHTDEIFAVGTGNATETSLGAFARPSDDPHIAFADQPEDLNQILGQIAAIIIGEEVFFRGSLSELLDVLSTDHGIPLDGNRATNYDEIVGGEPNNGADMNRECFVDSTDNFIALAWWVPVDHANEIQTDSVSFDLGFYTEQCRHNAGGGLPANNSTA